MPLDMFFRPRSIAVVGASADPGKLGYSVVDNLLRYGYGGEVHPVNPRADEILGRRAFPSVQAVPGQVDLTIAVVPARAVKAVLEDAGRAGSPGALVISAGFRETGAKGMAAEQELIEVARGYGMRLVGPNTLGIIDTVTSMNASFAEGMPAKAPVAVLSQSGAMCTALLDWAQASGMGFSHFVSLGNKADVNESDLLEAWIDDDEVQVVLGYLEGIADGPRFVEAARRLTRVKPFITLKVGTSERGQRAISSHTGSLAGTDETIDAVFRQCGVLRAHGFSDLQDFAQGFSRAGRLPRGRRVAIVTNAGGPAVMTTDALEGSGLEVAELAEATRDRLELVLPEAASTANPVDVLGDAQADRYDEALDAVMRDPGVDATIVLLTPQVMTEPETTARHVVREAKQSDKPVIAVFMGGEDIAGGVHVLDKGRVPVYDSPERAVRTLAMLAYYHDYLHFEREPAPVFEVDRAAVASVLDGARERGDRTLTGLEAARLFGAYGFPVLEGRVVGGPDEAVAHAEKAGWPVALKIASADVLHKMDVGAVRVDLRTETALRRAYGEILANVREHVPQARIDGMLVEPMAPRGREVILGMSRDPQFGPVILFGLGGVYVEVLKDVTFRLAPMLPLSARRMLGEIRARALLDGVRGEPPSDKAAIVDGLLRLSQLAVEQPGIAEVDVNPLIVTASGATGVDYRVILTEPGAAAAQR